MRTERLGRASIRIFPGTFNSLGPVEGDKDSREGLGRIVPTFQTMNHSSLKEPTDKLLVNCITREASVTIQLLMAGKLSKLDALQNIYWQLRTFLQGLRAIADSSPHSLASVLEEAEEALSTYHNIVSALIGDQEAA